MGKFLRILGLILLGLTAFFHLMGGIGTSCVALGAEKYDSMVGIVPFKWLYQLFVVTTIAIAIYAIRATVRFGKAKGRLLPAGDHHPGHRAGRLADPYVRLPHAAGLLNAE